MNKQYLAGLVFMAGLGASLPMPDGDRSGLVPSYAMSAAQAASADKRFLNRLVGKWRGRGTLDISGSGKREPISCKSLTHINKATGILVIEGQCSTQDGAGGFRINLGFNARRNRFEGSMLNTSKHNISTLSGKRTGNVLALVMRGDDDNLKARILTIAARGANSMSISGRATSLKTGARLNTGTIIFRRR